MLIKTVRPDDDVDRARAWFSEEARILGRLGRDGDTALVVPHVRHQGAADGLPFLVMDYIPGRSLLDMAPLESDHLVAVAIWLAEAVARCHRLGVVHNDLKPANVVLCPDGVRLVDFGLATDFGSSVYPTVHEGTFGYMAPERYTRAGGNVSSDVFSLGCTLAFAATRRPPFQGGTRQDFLISTTEGAADLDGIGHGLRRILERVLSTSPGDRPDASTVVHWLRAGATSQSHAGAKFTPDLQTATAAGWSNALLEWVLERVEAFLGARLAFQFGVQESVALRQVVSRALVSAGTELQPHDPERAFIVLDALVDATGGRFEPGVIDRARTTLDGLVDALRGPLLLLSTNQVVRSDIDEDGLPLDQLFVSISQHVLAEVHRDASAGGALAGLAQLDADPGLSQNAYLQEQQGEQLRLLRLLAQRLGEHPESRRPLDVADRTAYLEAVADSVLRTFAPQVGGAGRRVLSHDGVFVWPRLDVFSPFGDRALEEGVGAERAIAELQRAGRGAQLVAPLGTGKSFLLRHACLQGARQVLDDPDSADLEVLPVLVSASALQRFVDESNDLPTAIALASHAQLHPRLPLHLVSAVVGEALEDRRAALFVDAFDEHPGPLDARNGLWDALVASHTEGRLGQALLATTREHSAILDDRVDRFGITRLSHDDARVLAGRYLGQEARRRASPDFDDEWVGEGAKLIASCMVQSDGQLLLSPLHAVVLSWLFGMERAGAATVRLDDLRRPAEVYDLYFDTILDWEEAKQPLPAARESCISELGLLAARYLFGTGFWTHFRNAFPSAGSDSIVAFWRRAGIFAYATSTRSTTFAHRDLALYSLARLIVIHPKQDEVVGLLRGSLSSQEDDVLRLVEFQSHWTQ